MTGVQTCALPISADIAESFGRRASLFAGNAKAWEAAGLEVVADDETLPPESRVDFLFWLHDRHRGNAASSRAYLDWELGLPDAVAPEVTGFRLPKAPAASQG